MYNLKYIILYLIIFIYLNNLVFSSDYRIPGRGCVQVNPSISDLEYVDDSVTISLQFESDVLIDNSIKRNMTGIIEYPTSLSECKNNSDTCNRYLHHARFFNDKTSLFLHCIYLEYEGSSCEDCSHNNCTTPNSCLPTYKFINDNSLNITFNNLPNDKYMYIILTPCFVPKGDEIWINEAQIISTLVRGNPSSPLKETPKIENYCHKLTNLPDLEESVQQQSTDPEITLVNDRIILKQQFDISSTKSFSFSSFVYNNFTYHIGKNITYFLTKNGDTKILFKGKHKQQFYPPVPVKVDSISSLDSVITQINLYDRNGNCDLNSLLVSDEKVQSILSSCIDKASCYIVHKSYIQYDMKNPDEIVDSYYSYCSMESILEYNSTKILQEIYDNANNEALDPICRDILEFVIRVTTSTTFYSLIIEVNSDVTPQEVKWKIQSDPVKSISSEICLTPNQHVSRICDTSSLTEFSFRDVYFNNEDEQSVYKWELISFSNNLEVNLEIQNEAFNFIFTNTTNIHTLGNVTIEYSDEVHNLKNLHNHYILFPKSDGSNSVGKYVYVPEEIFNDVFQKDRYNFSDLCTNFNTAFNNTYYNLKGRDEFTINAYPLLIKRLENLNIITLNDDIWHPEKLFEFSLVNREKVNITFSFLLENFELLMPQAYLSSQYNIVNDTKASITINITNIGNLEGDFNVTLKCTPEGHIDFTSDSVLLHLESNSNSSLYYEINSLAPYTEISPLITCIVKSKMIVGENSLWTYTDEEKSILFSMPNGTFQVRQCFGYFSNDNNVCSGHGSCIDEDICICSIGYYGYECNEWDCYGENKDSANICNSRGICSSPNLCNCNSNYNGDNCEISICFGLLDNDDTVCSSHGICIEANNCSCSSGYFGYECEINSCFGKFSNTSDICSGRGECSEFDKCDCQSGYFGNNCSEATCFGIFSNSSNVCNGRGLCTNIDQCECSNNFYGENCSITLCFGILSNNSNVCSGKGICLETDICSCSENYYGSDCSIFECFEQLSNSSNVCNGRGICSNIDECQCSSNYYGKDCSVTSCFGILSNSSNVCNGKGVCSNVDECQCSDGYYGNNCSMTTCFGILSNSSNVCSSKGVCSEIDVCECSNGFYGGDCSITLCSGLYSNNSNVCSGKGTCLETNNCICSEGYYGSDCSITKCFDYLSNNTLVCSSHGKCTNKSTCDCDKGYSGSNCEIVQCFGINYNDDEVCSSRGKCIDGNKCECDYPYTGIDCSENNTCYEGEIIVDETVTVLGSHLNIGSLSNISLSIFFLKPVNNATLEVDCDSPLGSRLEQLNNHDTIKVSIPFNFISTGAQNSICIIRLLQESCTVVEKSIKLNLESICSIDDFEEDLLIEHGDNYLNISELTLQNSNAEFSLQNIEILNETDSMIRVLAKINYLIPQESIGHSKILIKCGSYETIETSLYGELNVPVLMIKKTAYDSYTDVFLEEIECKMEYILYPMYCWNSVFQKTQNIQLSHEIERKHTTIATTIGSSKTVLSVLSVIISISGVAILALGF